MSHSKRKAGTGALSPYLAAERLGTPNRSRPDLDPLRGHDLACWCSVDQPCHADVLLELANR